MPWFEEASKDIAKAFANDIAPSFEQAGKYGETLVASAPQELGKLAAGIEINRLPEHIVNFIGGNPVHMTLFMLNVLLFVAPALTTAPLLSALGFTAAEPVAGSVAAGWQSAIAPAATHGLFATLQSTAMGRCGASIIGGTVWTGALGSSVVAGLTLGGLEGHAGRNTIGVEVFSLDEALQILWEMSEPSAEDVTNSGSSWCC